MRVLVETLDAVIEGEVIGGEMDGGVSGGFDLEGVFTVRRDDGQCFLVHGWLVEVEVLIEDEVSINAPAPKWIM